MSVPEEGMVSGAGRGAVGGVCVAMGTSGIESGEGRGAVVRDCNVVEVSTIEDFEGREEDIGLSVEGASKRRDSIGISSSFIFEVQGELVKLCVILSVLVMFVVCRSSTILCCVTSSISYLHVMSDEHGRKVKLVVRKVKLVARK
jgi:hypothetical protein